MSFATPVWLLALALLPLGLLAGRIARRRARRYALRFPAFESLRLAVAESRPAQARRLLLPGLLALALVALAVALARPRVRHRVPFGSVSVMLVLDHSGSMASNDVTPTRIAAAIAAANTFIGELPANVSVGFVGFGSSPDAVQQPVPDHAAARRLLDAQIANGGTDTGPALAVALQLLDGRSARHPPAAVVLLSDGAANLGSNPVAVAAQARGWHIPIDTVAVGTPAGVLNVSPFQAPVPVPPDPELMAQIAHTSGGRTFDAQTAGELASIYTSLGSKLGSVERERDVTLWPLLMGAVALLAALGLARPPLRLSPRLRPAGSG